MTAAIIEMSGSVYEAMVAHLLPTDAYYEEAAFLFADPPEQESPLRLRVTEWRPIHAQEFACRRPDYLELDDAVRAGLIKRTHELKACLIECHSHPCHHPRFSWSDCIGLEELAPHVRWRLRGRPYAAIVVASNGYDSLVWSDHGKRPSLMAALEIDGRRMEPTGYTLSQWEQIRAARSFRP